MLSLKEIVLEILKEDFKNYCFDNADEFSRSDSEAYGDTYVSSGNYIDESSKEVLLSRFKDEKLSDIDSFMEDIINDDRFAFKIEELVKNFKGDQMLDKELRGLLLMAISAGQMNTDKHPMDILEEILRER